MTEHAFDTITRTVGTDRRRAMLALGAAGLATTLAGSFGASAKPSAGKKAKKKCAQQKQACLDGITAFCAPLGGRAADCVADLTPCCATCDVSTGVICAARVFMPTG
jgi:hypothetical protein